MIRKIDGIESELTSGVGCQKGKCCCRFPIAMETNNRLRAIAKA
ncbi:MAG TPA: hypothetical protein VFV31_12505 [Chitinophagaceae bacterium]|nr:hypothetical protein [Chitinophagaceae bacterium]